MFTFGIIMCVLLIVGGVGCFFLGMTLLAESDLGGVLALVLAVMLAGGGIFYVFDAGRRAGHFHGQVDAANGKVTVQLVTLPNGEKRWESK